MSYRTYLDPSMQTVQAADIDPGTRHSWVAGRTGTLGEGPSRNPARARCAALRVDQCLGQSPSARREAWTWTAHHRIGRLPSRTVSRHHSESTPCVSWCWEACSSAWVGWATSRTT